MVSGKAWQHGQTKVDITREDQIPLDLLAAVVAQSSCKIAVGKTGDDAPGCDYEQRQAIMRRTLSRRTIVTSKACISFITSHTSAPNAPRPPTSDGNCSSSCKII